MLDAFALLGPALAALIAVWLSGASLRELLRSVARWRVSPAWYAVAVGLPAALTAVQGVLFGLLGNPLDRASVPGRSADFVLTVLILALIVGLGEEPGWRWFALPRLRDRFAPVVQPLYWVSHGPSGICRWCSWTRGSRTASRATDQEPSLSAG